MTAQLLPSGGAGVGVPVGFALYLRRAKGSDPRAMVPLVLAAGAIAAGIRVGPCVQF